MIAKLTLPDMLPKPSRYSYDQLETNAPEGIYLDDENPKVRYLVLVGSGRRAVLYMDGRELRHSWHDSFYGDDRTKQRFVFSEEKLSLIFQK